MASTLNKLTDGTIELTMTIPWADVSKTYEHLVNQTVQNAELPGFRKGKAPRDLVEKSLDKAKLYEEVLKVIIPEAYNDAITEHKLKPVISPKVELKEANEGKDWIISALTCQKPAVTLGNYKQAISDLKAGKQKKIWVPGAEPKPDDKDKPTKPTLDEILRAVYSTVTVSIPALLVENEVNRLLSDLIDQTKKLGLSVEQYLASTNRTAESIRREYEEQGKRTLTLEFALEEIADKEGVLISDDEIDTVIKTAKTEDEQKALSAQRYYLASLLRRQKTLDTIASL
ncbi:hypothetical protein HY031_00135 [Candidatus Gottesmanbacteria bacterium]|nr:hypothetical protein [Candidatus Gottesmanbacteria bacterium]